MTNCLVIESGQKNLGLKAFCIIENKQIDDKQRILIQSITDNLGMLYIIFASQFYKS
ncbi:MAG: hypothetical protein JW816_00700 [Candidatus Buchananbacteria bacterium]|nr:hypothetical protein [Candidatus Buchananbacteria bacterium]